MFVVAVFLIPGRSSDTVVPFDNPFGQAGLVGEAAKVVVATGLALHVVALLAALVCVVLRFRASREVERQQLRWVATGAAVTVLGVTVPLGDLRGAWVDPLVILCVPLAVAVAVLRYRLWDLDRLVSRTVTYALVTALLVVPYLLIVPAAGRLAAGSGSLAVVDRTMQPASTSLWLRPYRR
jgi:two-component system, NarL family, sensor kinase